VTLDSSTLRRENVREVRRCEGCGYDRPVLVRYSPISCGRLESYSGPERDRPFLWRQDVSWPRYCGACQKEAQAHDYMKRAKKLMEDAASIRTRRREKKT
jgi:hypothetical protein